MKTFKYIVIFLMSMLAVTFTSCSSDHLDAELTDYISKERLDEILKDPVSMDLVVKASLKSTYEKMRLMAGGHDSFGLKSIHLTTDLMTSDMVLDVHHHFGWDYNLDNHQAPYRRTSSTWGLFYSLISYSNINLRDFFSEDSSDEVFLALKAEVLAIRGIAYYHLINLYQKTYLGHEDMPGVPLVLKPEDENMPRETVRKVYEQIIADLEYAIEYGVVTDNNEDADKLVAAAYAAKAYAAMERWDDVIRCAKIVVDGAKLHAPSSSWEISDSEWLWGCPINGQTSTLYASFYSHMDPSIGGYAGGLGVTKSIYNVLYNKIPDTDKRKLFFINKEKFPDLSNQYPNLKDYVSVKFITASDFSGDYCYIRVADPYLLLAEAYVEKGDLASAKAVLTTFLDTRDPGFDANKFTTQEMLREEVRLQRAVELWGEGTSFYDMKRWKTGLDRRAEGSNHRIKEKRAADSNKFEFQIPQKEMETNSNIKVQNPANDPQDG